MKSNKYLIDRLNELQKKFANLSIRYQYNPYTLKHIVEILPFSDYETNDDYIEYEAELSFEFDNNFFPESIMFISEGSLTKITNPDFILEKQVFSMDEYKIEHSFSIEREDNYVCVEYTDVDKSTYCLAA